MNRRESIKSLALGALAVLLPWRAKRAGAVPVQRWVACVYKGEVKVEPGEEMLYNPTAFSFDGVPVLFRESLSS